MSMDKKVNQINWDFALHDIMDIICKRLDFEDLRNLANVSKSWHNAASREKAKRFYIAQLRFPYKFADPSELIRKFGGSEKIAPQFSTNQDSPALSSMLDVKPYVSLLIYDWRMNYECKESEKSLKLMLRQNTNYFKKDLPNKVILVEVEKYLTSEDVGLYGEQDQRKLEQAGNCPLHGLFFPRVEQQARVHAVWQPELINDLTIDEPVEWAKVVDRLGEELGLNDCEYPKSTLIWFVTPYNVTAARLPHEVKKRFSNRFNGQTTVWTCEVGTSIVAADSDRTWEWDNEEHILAGLRISGPRVDSWTITVDLELPGNVIDEQLLQLKGKVTRRRHSIGLYCAPLENSYGSTQEIMFTVKCLFPDIPFLGMSYSHHKGYNFKDLPEESLTLNNYQIPFDFECLTCNQRISLIIISYD